MKRTFLAAAFAALLAVPAFFMPTPASASCGCSMYRTAGDTREEVSHFNTPALYAAAPVVGVKVPAFSHERLIETDGPTHCEAMLAMEPVQAHLRTTWASMSATDRYAVQQIFASTENAVFDLAVPPEVQRSVTNLAPNEHGPTSAWLAMFMLLACLSLGTRFYGMLLFRAKTAH